MRLYIAGGSDELEIAEHYISKARQAGAVITFDWPANIRAVGNANPASVEDKRPHADECANAVRSAQCVWALMPRNKSEGMFYELGIAYALGVPFVISGERANAHLFSAHAVRLYEHHHQAMDSLRAQLAGHVWPWFTSKPGRS